MEYGIVLIKKRVKRERKRDLLQSEGISPAAWTLLAAGSRAAGLCLCSNPHPNIQQIHAVPPPSPRPVPSITQQVNGHTHTHTHVRLWPHVQCLKLIAQICQGEVSANRGTLLKSINTFLFLDEKNLLC